MDVLLTVGYGIMTAAAAILTYFVKRYVTAQDARFAEMTDDFKQLTTQFMETITELREALGSLKAGSNTHRALCDERHGMVRDRLKKLEDTLEDVRFIKQENHQ